MPSKMLTDAFVNSTLCVPKEGRIEWWDIREPGLALRVSANGRRFYIVSTRYPNHPQPTRRSIDKLIGPPRDVEHAREICREWRRMVKAGKDPKTERAKEAAAAQEEIAQEQGKTFRAVLEAYLAYKTEEKHATVKATAMLFQREVPKDWLDRPACDIRKHEITKVVQAIRDRGHKGQAHAMFGAFRNLFVWALPQTDFGIDASPVVGKAKLIVGKKQVGDRVLTDAELKAVWEAATKTAYAFGDITRLLMLTGARLNDIAKLQWGEIDLDAGLISIPAARMKMRVPFEIPITSTMAGILKAISRQRGPYVFSTTNGFSPFAGVSKAKSLLDKLSGADEWMKDGEKNGYVNHDLRRTARTRWSPIPSISTEVKEVAMAHTLKGMQAVYDQYAYRDEKSALLTAWERILLAIVNPPADTNVVRIVRRPMGGGTTRHPLKLQRRPMNGAEAG